MGPARAIRTGLVKSFQFSGRASRTEFWWFAPVALIPPVVGGTQLSLDNIDFWGIWRVGVLILLGLPLIAAMSRRLQDMGEPGHQALLPFMPFVFLWVGYQAIYWFSVATWITGLGMILGILALFAFGLIYFVTAIASLFVTASIIGMMLVASDPRSNRYGPPPSEVTP
ncbi:MAG: DUF805 domain-containing protein [Paracoccaceae bacterium]